MEVNQKVKDFFMKLGEDEELRGKLEVAAKRQDLAECALLSREAGFDLTRADLEYMANLAKAYESGELTEAQLEMVSGGSAVLAVLIVLETLLVGAVIGAVISGTGVIVAGSIAVANSKG